MGIELELIEKNELLEDLMVLTNNNLGLSHQLLSRVIKKTEQEVKITLKEMADNIEREKRNARRRGMYALNRNMCSSSRHFAKPKGTAAHHIVALTDSRAEQALKILLRWGIDFNDEINGVYLPRFKRNVPHNFMPNAIAHSQTHTEMYHENIVTTLLDIDQMPGVTRDDIMRTLQEIGEDLQDGSFPV
ncbi:MAG: AHH domain-containing protein [Gammaproteobacteria bacterium]|nr:AHH domain-containing protein [Gammaproteobacteria bacterium]